MDAEEALRVLQAGGKITNRQGRGVAADHCFRAGRRLDTAQHWALDLRPFEYRLLDQIRFGDRLGHAIGGSEVLSHQFRRTRLEQPSVLEVLSLLAKSIEMTRSEGGIGVHDHHIHARHREDLGDSATHVSGADDSDVLDHGINPRRKINRTFSLTVASSR